MCHPKTSVAAPTPCSDGKHVYAIFSSNDLVCFDLDGNLQWLRGITYDYPNVSNSLGMSQSPVVMDGTLVNHLSITLYATMWGFLIGSFVGFALGLLFGRFRALAEVLDPYITALYSIPKIALAPLFIIWFGIGIESKVAVSASIVFFVVFLNTYAGVRDVNPLFINAIRIMGGSQWHVLRQVIMPSATSWVITGLKVSVPYALVGTVIGEFMSSNRGIGFLISQATGLFDTTSVFSGLIVLSIVGAIFNQGLGRLETFFLRWR
jgi:NitT/TauT family transport system permease protein